MMDPIVIRRRRCAPKQKNSGTVKPFRRQVKSADCGEIPSFEYKLRGAGPKKVENKGSQTAGARGSLPGRERGSNVFATWPWQVRRRFHELHLYVGDIIAGRWRVTDDRWSSPAFANGRATLARRTVRSLKTVNPTLAGDYEDVTPPTLLPFTLFMRT